MNNNEQQHLRNKRQCLENKQQKKLKSTPPATAPAFATFRNCSPRIANILWLSFQGDRVTYTKNGLNPRQKMDMNTYEGHPWIFRDYHTGDKLVISTEANTQEREVFFPVPWSEDNSQRVEVTILLPVYTLKERSLQVVRSLMQNKADFEKLEIPISLQSQLANLEDTVNW